MRSAALDRPVRGRTGRSSRGLPGQWPGNPALARMSRLGWLPVDLRPFAPCLPSPWALEGAEALGADSHQRRKALCAAPTGVNSMRTGLVQQDVRDDFDRARRRANWAKVTGWLLGRSAGRNRLAVLGEVSSASGAGGLVRRLEYEPVGRIGSAGEVMVPISQIVGTVEPTRCFDRQFRPTSDDVRRRFQRIAVEVRSGRGMDPVELFRCNGSYYVLDGHHRIAVARALGERSVSALVTEVRLNNPAPSVPQLPDQRPQPDRH
jgi:hypothetical protein